MATATHEGGPADGVRLSIEQQTHVRYYAPAAERASRGWLSLARYVFVPPRDGARCRYRYTGIHQARGPVPGDEKAPDWSAT